MKLENTVFLVDLCSEKIDDVLTRTFTNCTMLEEGYICEIDGVVYDIYAQETVGLEVQRDIRVYRLVK